MIGLDTNVLARYYVEDKADAQATRQRAAARRLTESGQPPMVCKTVLLEFDGSCAATTASRRSRPFRRCGTRSRWATSQSMIAPQSSMRYRIAKRASTWPTRCITPAAEHATFDDQRFARRAKKLVLAPAVVIPS